MGIVLRVQVPPLHVYFVLFGSYLARILKTELTSHGINLLLYACPFLRAGSLADPSMPHF